MVASSLWIQRGVPFFLEFLAILLILVLVLLLSFAMKKRGIPAWKNAPLGRPDPEEAVPERAALEEAALETAAPGSARRGAGKAKPDPIAAARRQLAERTARIEKLLEKGSFTDALIEVELALKQFPFSPDLARLKVVAEERITASLVRSESPTQQHHPTKQHQPAMGSAPVTSPPPDSTLTRTEETPRTVHIDNVHFMLTGPGVLVPGAAQELQFWVHLEEQKSEVLLAASQANRLDYSKMAIKTEGPYPLERGSRLSVRLSILRMKCLDSHKWITWTGEIGSTTFVVKVPPDASEGRYPGKASIRLNGCEIAKMSFVLYVGSPSPRISEIPSQTTSYRRAFASYASQDRAEVLGRVQGMEAAYKGLNVFVDVIDLRSGQNWERELRQHISTSDVFYLFWCRHAMKSVWVEKEWRLALEAKGYDFIDPVPLEAPTFAPAPAELAIMHFNDPLLAFIAAAGGGHSSQA